MLVDEGEEVEMLWRVHFLWWRRPEDCTVVVVPANCRRRRLVLQEERERWDGLVGPDGEGRPSERGEGKKDGPGQVFS
jgi:hypothetical protein